MIRISGKPFLEYQLNLLKRNGITDIVLSVGYLGEQIKEYFKDGAGFGIQISYSIEKEPMGTGGGIKQASGLLDEDFFVIYGDSYLSIDYADVARFFKSSGRIGLMVTYDNRWGDTDVMSNVSVDEEMLVTRYKKGVLDRDLTLVEAGVLAFRKDVLKFIPADRVVSLEEEIFPALIKKRQLISYATKQRFYDIGLADRLKEFEELVK